MQWIFDNLQIVALVVLAVGSLIKQVIEKRAEARQADRDTPGNDPTFEDDEPSWRQDPPPLPRQVEPPPLPRTLAPIEEDTGELLRRQLEMQERLQQIRRDRAVAAQMNQASPGGKGQPQREKQRHGLSVRPLLASRASLRQAVILREILGPPVGLR